MTLDELKAMLADGSFHHATYRNFGNLWEGLYIYRRSSQGLRGFDLAGAFNKRQQPEELSQAENIVRGTGVSVGSYGRG